MVRMVRKQNQTKNINCYDGKKWTHKGANHSPGVYGFNWVLKEQKALTSKQRHIR